MNLECDSRPLVSIIIPVYNVERYLRRCLDSVLAQTYTNFEAVIVDDGSTDNGGTICDEYAEKDIRFVVIHKQNEGVSIARLIAFEHSRGEFITFIDSDDYVDANYIGHLLHQIMSHHVDMAGCQYFEVINGFAELKVRPIIGYYDREGIKGFLQQNFLYDYRVGCGAMIATFWAKILKRDLVLNMLQTACGLSYSEDLTGLIYLLYQIDSIYMSEVPLYFYCQREGQVSGFYNFARWQAYIKSWKRIAKIDKNKYFKEQLPYRVYGYLIQYIKGLVRNKTPFNEFYMQLNGALNDDFVLEAIDHNFTKFGLVDRMKIWLIRHRHYYLCYLTEELIIFVKKIDR